MPAGDVIENPAAGMTLRLLRTAAETAGDLLEMEATYAPGSSEPPRHFHPSQEEHFEVQAGAIEVDVDGARRTLAAGDVLEIPAWTVHAMWNEGTEEEARVLWQTRPALRSEEFFRAVGRLARAGKLTASGPRDPLAGAALMHRFRDEVRLTSPPPPVQAVAFPLLATVAKLLSRNP